jgi:glycosyltransferase involved in cell wall biosynthesis
VSRPRDVFLVANNLEELGGVQRVTHNLAALMSERGHRVTAVGIQHAPHPHDYGPHGYRMVTINDDKEPAAPAAGSLRGRIDPRVRTAQRRNRDFRETAARRLTELFAAAEDGIVVVLQVWAMGWVAAADTNGMPVVGMSHESFEATLASSRWPRVQRYFKDVDLLLLLTEADALRFEAEGFNNVGVMHNSLSFYPDHASDVTAPVVVAAGRYAREKGFDALIDAFALVAPDHPEWQLRIFGHGPLQARLEAQAQRLGLADRVRIPGLARDIEQELLGSSVFALSSLHEGLPMALAEAMACGLPAVAFDCAPGVREMVTDGEDGIVVDPHDVPAMAEGLSRLMTDDSMRKEYGAAARRNIRKFAPEAVLAEWERVFDQVQR